MIGTEATQGSRARYRLRSQTGGGSCRRDLRAQYGASKRMRRLAPAATRCRPQAASIRCSTSVAAACAIPACQARIRMPWARSCRRSTSTATTRPTTSWCRSTPSRTATGWPTSALAIAIGIDSLIFMTGLFGANAVRSPLSDVPSMKARNSQELNAMIETALLPDTFRTARLVGQSMHPIENVEGYSNEVRLDELDPETAVQVRDVLNAGAIIGAVRRGDQPGHYLVRSELLEFLNTVIKRELETNKEQAEAGMLMDQDGGSARRGVASGSRPQCRGRARRAGADRRSERVHVAGVAGRSRRGRETGDAQRSEHRCHVLARAADQELGELFRSQGSLQDAGPHSCARGQPRRIATAADRGTGAPGLAAKGRWIDYAARTATAAAHGAGGFGRRGRARGAERSRHADRGPWSASRSLYLVDGLGAGRGPRCG